MSEQPASVATKKTLKNCLLGCCGHCAGNCRQWGMLPLRVLMGLVFILHGWAKLYGPFTIAGFTGFLTSLHVPLPEVMAWVVALVEFVGGIALLIGAFTPLAASLIAVDMGFAWFLTRPMHGLFSQGVIVGELELSLFAIALSLAITGSGPWSIDAWRCRHKK